MTNSYILKKSVKSLPLNWYYDLKQYEKEVGKVWKSEWLYACHEDNLKEPLSYLTLQVSNFNILILRDKKGLLAAYLNTCRHRGSILCKRKRR